MTHIDLSYRFGFLSVVLCFMLASCSSSDEIAQNEDKDNSELFCEAKEKTFIGDITRSSLSLDLAKGGMAFAWTEGDGMTVFAKDDSRATQLYMLESGVGQARAKFNADNFKLTLNKLYYAFSKVEGRDAHVDIPSQNNITVDYSGQTQIGNASTKHLGEYDFMAAGTQCVDENSAHFLFYHLGSTLRVLMKFDNVGLADGDEKTALNLDADNTSYKKVRFTEMEIFDSENSFRQTERHFSFAEGTQGDTYTFKWPEQVIDKMDRFTLRLKADGSEEGVSRFDAFMDGSGDNTKNRLIGYMEIPPMDFTNKKIGIMLKGSYKKLEGGKWVEYPVSYIGTYEQALNVVAGNAYQINVDMKKPDDFKVTLKINHMWQHGSTLDQTRSASTTGDPGYDKEIATPAYIYYIYCHDGKVVKPTTDSGEDAVTEISGLTAGNWDTQSNDGTYISTYKGKGSGDNGIITLQKPDCTAGHDCSYHLYVVASQSALNLSGVALGSSEETVVRALTYDLPNTGVQVFMRDLYSTPWSAADFVGNLTDPIQDVTLYHVAAKVDLKWNSSTSIERVTVDKVKKENLYIFQPTQNTDGIVQTGGYTETMDMDVDQQFNGRCVFYLPQFKSNCTYNLTLGNNSPEEVTFSPVSTQGGFTSWLRWLKKNTPVAPSKTESGSTELLNW